MQLVVQEEEKKQEALIIDERPGILPKRLKKELVKHDVEVFNSPFVPTRTDRFNYIFLINKRFSLDIIRPYKKQRLIFIYVNKKREAKEASSLIRAHRFSTVKVITTNSDHLDEAGLEKLLWFSFSKSHEITLSIDSELKKTSPVEKTPKTPVHRKPFFTRRKIVWGLILIFLFFHLAMYPPLLSSSYLMYRSASAFKNGEVEKARSTLNTANSLEAVGEKLYSLARPSYLLFSLALFPDNLVDMNSKGIDTLDRSYSSYENANQIITLLLKKNKSTQEKAVMEARIAKLKVNAEDLKNNLIFLDQKLSDVPFGLSNSLRADFTKSIELISKINNILPYTDQLFAKGTEAKYLLLFANNMELRPGGGFIGSFGVLTMKDLTLEDLKVYDVYDADGQLTTHINPPDPIRQYLGQPNWFLRDSAFSPDFFDNYNQAKYFLDQEIKLNGFSGGMMITTSSIQNIIDAYGNLFLPDFNEQITRDNFYLKAQYYAENNFFPGSIQKKSFLGSVANQIMLNIDTVSSIKLFTALKKSLDEKQITVLFDDPEIQHTFDTLYWSGKTIVPRCALQNTNCVIDYTFPIDANLGVNKANFFVTRLLTQRVSIHEDGSISSNLYIKIKNDSPNDVFPGGRYKDYFQVFIPKGSRVSSVTKDNEPVVDFDQNEVEFTSVGFLVEIPPQKSAEIKVSYDLPDTLKKGKGVYQLIFQKQIGSPNSDFVLEISLPKNISLINQNFSPLVKDGRIFYNTSLNADKIFFLELSK